MDTKQNSQTIKFEVGNALAGTPNFFRERKADRIRRAKALLTTPLTFLSPIGEEYGKALANGATLTLLGHSLTTANPESLRCVICHGVHGQPRKGEQLSGDAHWKGERLALVELFSQNGKVFPVSETCVKTYIIPNADQGSIANYPEFAKFHGLPSKPVAKPVGK